MNRKTTIFPVSNSIAEVYAPFLVRFIHREIQILQADEVLIRIMASAICGSDLHIYKGKHPSAPLPVTIGHEFSGEVAAIGDDVHRIKPGMRVTVEPCVVCGTCEACRHGNYSYCENISFTYREGNGAMADYIVVKESNVYPLPDYLSYETGALIEPLSVATHAVRRANISLDDSVLIIGDGAIGLMITAMCQKCGASQIIVAGHSDSRLEVALQFGATQVINTHKECLSEKILSLTNRKGVTKSFECVGKEACFHQAIESLRRNGVATIVGIYENQELHFSPARLVTHEIHIQGTQGYCWDFPIAIEAAKTIPLELVITHRFPLRSLDEALHTALDHNSNSIKILLKNEM